MDENILPVQAPNLYSLSIAPNLDSLSIGLRDNQQRNKARRVLILKNESMRASSILNIINNFLYNIQCAISEFCGPIQHTVAASFYSQLIPA